MRAGSISCAAFHGAAVWTIYAVVECWMAVILPWIVEPGYQYTAVHRGFTLLTFIVYPLFGAALAVLLALGLRSLLTGRGALPDAEVRLRHRSAATATLVLVLVAHLLYQRAAFSSSLVLPMLLLYLALATAVVVAARPGFWRSSLGFLATPWTVSLLPVGLLCLDKRFLDTFDRTVKLPALAAYLTLLPAAAFLIHRRLGGLGRDACASAPLRRVLPVALLTAAFSLLPRQTPRDALPESIAAPTAGDRPNVILISLDTVRADHLSLYGYQRDTTPNLKDFASAASLFTRAVASSDMTLPSHASTFTGQYASWHGAHHTPRGVNGLPLSQKATTLAEIFAKNSYLTMGVVANYAMLTHVYALDQGFQYYDQHFPATFLGWGPNYLLRSLLGESLARFAGELPFEGRYRSAQEINSEVFALLDRVRNARAPFLLFVNYMDAHWPYLPPPPFDTRFPGKDPSFTSSRQHADLWKIQSLEARISAAQRGHLLSQYDGAIAYLDLHLGKLFARLKEQGLFDNSLIIITSDHGEAFGDRDLIGHAVSVYQDQVHVPLIIKYPRSRQGQVVDSPVSFVDILPTAMHVAGLPAPPGAQGVSLLDPASRSVSRILISESFPSGFLLSCHPRFHRIERAVTSGSFKLITSTAGKRELYDLVRDPNETQSVYKQHQELARTLQANLDTRLKSVAASSDASFKLNPQTLDRLKTLGYIQ